MESTGERAGAERSEHVERELKLAVRPDSLEAIKRVPLLEAVPARHLHELTTYYDTAALDLMTEGAALRIRRRGNRLIQTLKTSAGSGIASERGEWEWDLGTDQPKLSLLGETPRGALAEALDGRLMPVFKTDIDRVVRLIPSEDGAIAEIAIDAGEIIAGDAHAPVSEIELELKSGSNPAALYRLALRINEHVPLMLAPDSKAARGYRLFAGGRAKVVKAPRIDFPDDVTAAEGFREIVASALSHLAANVGLAEAGDAEGVHQVRVALRRLRAALLVFKRTLDRRTSQYFSDSLRALGQLLGAARDWDVFVLETLATAKRDHPGAGWPGELARAAAGRRLEAQAQAAAALAGGGFTRLVLELSAWIEDGVRDPAVLGGRLMGKPLKKVAATLLDRVEAKARSRGSDIGHLNDEELHALRKTLKKLRYDAEFFESLYSREAVKAYRKQCEHLQDLLGQFNDARTTADLLPLLAEGDHRPVAAAEAAHAWAESRRIAALAEIGPAWTEFHDAAPFWK